MRYKKILILFVLFLVCLQPAVSLDNAEAPQETDLHIKRKNLFIGYSKTYRQAIWVAYTLDADKLLTRQVRRKDKFQADPAVKYRPVKPKDYNRSGYDKGHLAPAADMTYSEETMKNSFYMTNITPQIPGCNRGIWKRIESQVRRWALSEGKLYIVTGPVFDRKPKKMGNSKIPVPSAFYKVVLDLTPPMKMIGFFVPNETSKRHVSNFVLPVDEVERITGYDFFSELDDEIEKKLQQHCDFSAWK